MSDALFVGGYASSGKASIFYAVAIISLLALYASYSPARPIQRN